MPDSVAHETVYVEAPDGARLATDLYRPAGSGRHPGLLLRVPYDRTIAQTRGYAHPSWYARHGFVVAVQDVRGRFDSEGDWEPFVHEAADGAHSISYLAEHPSCTGLVGTYGYSYPGTIQLCAAARRPHGLMATAPGFFSTDIVGDWAYPGGVLAQSFCLDWAVELARERADADADVGRLLETRRHGGDDAYAEASLEPRAVAGLRGVPWPDWPMHPPGHDFWQRYDDLRGPAPVPGLFVGGWFDLFTRGTLAEFRRAAVSSRLLVGPWLHAPWVWSKAASGQRVDQRQVEWFRHVLAGDSLPERPPVEVFALGAETWLYEQTWPPAGVSDVTWHLRGAGRANTRYGDGCLTTEAPIRDEWPDVTTTEPLAETPTRANLADPYGPADQLDLESRPATLVYTTDAFSRETFVAGSAELDLSVAVRGIPQVLAGVLCRVDEAGRSTRLCEGIAAVPADGASGELRVRISLGELCVVLRPGERLRLDVCASRYPRWDVLAVDDAVRHGGKATLRPTTYELCHSAGRPSVLRLGMVL